MCTELGKRAKTLSVAAKAMLQKHSERLQPKHRITVTDAADLIVAALLVMLIAVLQVYPRLHVCQQTPHHQYTLDDACAA